MKTNPIFLSLIFLSLYVLIRVFAGGRLAAMFSGKGEALATALAVDLVPDDPAHGEGALVGF